MAWARLRYSLTTTKTSLRTTSAATVLPLLRGMAPHMPPRAFGYVGIHIRILCSCHTLAVMWAFNHQAVKCTTADDPDWLGYNKATFMSSIFLYSIKSMHAFLCWLLLPAAPQARRASLARFLECGEKRGTSRYTHMLRNGC
jgi:hypothetical protein